MSTLVCETITNGTNSISVTDNVIGTAKAFVYWNATVDALNASYNVSSVVDLPGNYTEITFTTPFANTNYVAAAGPLPLNAGNNPFVLQELFPRTTSKITLYGNSASTNPSTRLPATFSMVFYSA